ncbi:uncharacterized protein BO97DRAFT_455788 [Aspergillus homomorphus CBS 101889]|uniref:Pyrin domain-containing protein n=1 Tax=Aspergillus homomorphus (strain CBS 101889) TaxID=1450537 RepID=A0A395I7W1_ASPHC|nr:hypothetical protein BO97DRAFT_455788 [Aspergillus homomorphus CBS 101889]RAL16310.1 hypothetical protein BO97DRAFT_455788 [Aspergillus homomorphus CBS 101889]
MSTFGEQVFFYGKGIDPFLSSGLNMFTIFDLTIESTFVFAIVILSAYLIDNMAELAPWIVFMTKKSIFSPARTLLRGTRWALTQLSTRESRQNLYHWCYASARKRVLNFRSIHLLSLAALWFIPSENPIVTIVMFWVMILGAKEIHISVLVPSYYYLTGVTAGLSPTGLEQYEDCLAYIARSGLPVRWGSRQHQASYRCTGVGAGLELIETLKDNDRRLPPLEHEIPHVHIVAVIAGLILTIYVAVWFMFTLPGMVAASGVGKLQTGVKEQRESHLRDMLKASEAANEQLRALLDIKDEEFRTMKLRLEEDARRQEESARRQATFIDRRVDSAVRQGQNDQLASMDALRKKIVEVENKLTTKEAQAHATDDLGLVRERLMQDRIKRLETQLARTEEQTATTETGKELQTVKKKLRARNNEIQTLTAKLVAAENCLVAAEENSRRGDLEHESLKGELQLRTDKLSAIEERLAAAELHQKGEAEREHIIITQDQKIQTLRDELSARTNELQTSTQKLSTVEARLNTAEDTAQQAKTEMQKISNQAQAQELQKLRDALRTRTHELETCTEKLNTAEASFSAASETTQQAVANVQKSHQQELSSLKEALRERATEIQAYTDSLADVQARLATAEELNRQASIEQRDTRNQDQEKELQSAKAALQARNSEVQAYADRLAEVEARLATANDHNLQSETEHRNLLAQNRELHAQSQKLHSQNQDLQAQHQQIAAEYEALRISHEAALHQPNLPLETMRLERDAAIEKCNALDEELMKALLVADLLKADEQLDLKECQQALEEERRSAANSLQSMQELKVACDMTIAQERSEAEQARTKAFLIEDKMRDIQDQLKEVKEENRTLQVKVSMAMGDAQGSHERAEKAKRINKILEARLSQWEDKARDEQSFVKRQTADVGSVTTALQQCQVKVSEQQTRIQELTEKLEKAKTERPIGEVEQKLRDDFSMMKSMLDREKRAHMEDQIRLCKEKNDLEEEVRKLRISISNARTERHAPMRKAAAPSPGRFSPCEMDECAD